MTLVADTTAALPPTPPRAEPLLEAFAALVRREPRTPEQDALLQQMEETLRSVGTPEFAEGLRAIMTPAFWEQQTALFTEVKQLAAAMPGPEDLAREIRETKTAELRQIAHEEALKAVRGIFSAVVRAIDTGTIR